MRKPYLISLCTDFILHCPLGLDAMDQPQHTDEGMCGHATCNRGCSTNSAVGNLQSTLTHLNLDRKALALESHEVRDMNMKMSE